MRLAVAALVLCSCATPLSALSARREVETPAGKITVCSLPHQAADDAGEVASGVAGAAPKVGKWGRLGQPVELHLLPSHWDLAVMTRRFFFGWLRAWATYDDVLIQTPSTWSATEKDVTELLAHELTHCLMYQRTGSSTDWPTKNIPLWFREGMASWTAEQGYRWMTLEDLARVYEEQPPVDPLAQADALYRDRSGAVYGAAHHAFTFLVKRYGQPAIEQLMSGMARGEPFDAAFHGATGLEPPQFTAEFRRYIVWRGFKGGRKRQPDSAQ